MKTQISFSYPRRGLEGLFATFRLGANWSKKVVPGEVVELVDARSKKVLKLATVEAVHAGAFDALAPLHAHEAHNWKAHPADERVGLLMTSMAKRYPPGRVTPQSVVSVIYLREIQDDSSTLKP